MIEEKNDKYVFIHVAPDCTRVRHVLENTVTAHEVVRSFYYFLKGVSFANSSIVSALEDVAEEMKEHV